MLSHLLGPCTSPQVYLLSRMGAQRDALLLVLNELRDIPAAVDFVRQSGGDAELWQALLTHAMASAPLAQSLLEHVAADPLRTLDTLALVRQLPDGVSFPGLPTQLTALLVQADAQFSLARSALGAAHADRASLLRERHRLVQRGTLIGDELAAAASSEATARQVNPGRTR